MKRGVDIAERIAETKFLKDRVPTTTAERESKAFAKLSAYRNGAIFAGSFSGRSPWECHFQGDEIVQVIEGNLAITLLNEKGEIELVS